VEAKEPLTLQRHGEAIARALAWLRNEKVELEESFETRMNSFGMRNADGSGGYRIEFTNTHAIHAHINVWSGKNKGPHYTFPGNLNAVKSLWRQLYSWDPKLKRRSPVDG